MARIQYGSVLRLAVVVVLWALLAGPATAAQRVALVIGNAAYAHAPALANPLNDAADVSAVLGRLGFDVHVTPTRVRFRWPPITWYSFVLDGEVLRGTIRRVDGYEDTTEMKRIGDAGG